MSISNNDDDLKHYYKEIKTLLPLKGEPEKRFLFELESSIKDYIRDNPEYKIKELYEEFGSPSDVVANYFDTIDTSRLVKRIRITKYIRITLVLVLIIALVFSVYRSILIYKDYMAGKEANITTVEETINEEE